MTSITLDDVRHVAKLARLGLDDQQLERMTGELGMIIDSIGKISELDLADVPLDAPIGEVAQYNTQGIVQGLIDSAPDKTWTFGDLLANRSINRIVGTPEQIADLIEDWFRTGAADGFNIMPPILPAMLDAFTAEVIPLLQRRGLFRRAYAGKTLREHYGLTLPPSRFED